jgi:hypothetical protein
MPARASIGRAGALWALASIGWAGLAAATDADWGYVIGQPRENQQANFCTTRESIAEIARIFDRFGPRTGYAALSASPDCTLAVHSFTPRALLASVTISDGQPGAYPLNFVDVETHHGKRLYLVTTRAVAGE